MVKYRESILRFLDLLGEIFAFVIIAGTVMGLLITIYLSLLSSESYDINALLSFDSIPFYVIQCIGYLAAIFLLSTTFFPRSLRLGGLLAVDRWLPFGRSAGLAGILMTVGFILLWAVGEIKDVYELWSWSKFGFLLVLFIFQSGAEELLSRSFLQVCIEERYGSWTAIIVSSLVFFLLHYGNPNVTTLGLVNLFLAGVLFGVILVAFRNFWYLLGFHAGWNFFQGTVYDFNVSGIDFYSMLRFDIVDENIWSGGSFGIEGSILTTITLIVLTGLVVTRRVSPSDNYFGLP